MSFTTGRSRAICRCKPGTWISIVVGRSKIGSSCLANVFLSAPLAAPRKDFACGVPHTNTKVVSRIHGTHAETTWLVEYAGLAPGVSPTDTGGDTGSSGNRQVSFGFQTFRNNARLMSETSPP